MVTQMEWEALPDNVQDRVLSYMSIASIALLGATNRTQARDCQEHIRARVNTGLGAFHLQGEKTLDMLQETGSVVSGSTPLSFLVPRLFAPQDADVYVPKGALPRVHEFLVREARYLLVYETSCSDTVVDYRVTADNGIRRVLFYIHVPSAAVVNVVESTQSSPVYPILRFHSTLVMNYITGNAIVCTYPKMTTARVGLLNHHRRNQTPTVQAGLAKYRGRGFTFLTSAEDWKASHECGVDGYCGISERRLDDSFTLKYVFRSSSTQVPHNLSDLKTVWRLGCQYPCKLPDPTFPLRGEVSVVAM